jgi:glycosyltransferase involved in cell wall biosynthesis
MLTFSIVINTLNRGNLLQKTLESFRWLKYDGAFEVIVVNGPSTDSSNEVIASWLPRIRAGKCDVANLSVSRNIGICMAQGDIVAFIDDDAIPEPEWLSHLAQGYDSAEIGGTGGLVFDQTGYSYQYQYSTANRLANANWAEGGSAEHYCFPGSFKFPYLQGTNASFRRSALLEVGGFDEELEYYLDETELCCRLIDAGYVIRQLPNAYVHHKFAPSNIRDEHKITRYRYPVIKNKIYFSLKHGRKYLSLSGILEDNRKFSSAHEADVEFHIIGGRLKDAERERFKEENEKAWERGILRGLSDDHELITLEKLCKWRGDFLPFEPIVHDRARAVVLVSRDFPPNHGGGIATFNKDLAEALAAEGNLVHVITQSTDINRVDFENGVWVHRMVIREIACSPEAIERNIPQHVWNWSATALEETRRIATHRTIDAVEAPIWDCEGVAFLLDDQWPLVTSLHTTLHFWLDSHPEHRQDEGWMQSFGLPMLAMEKELMLRSNAIRSNSSAIRRDIESAYAFQFEDKKICVVHHGMPREEISTSARVTNDTVTILFVGRLESRKGIDVLLAAIPRVLEKNPKVRFRILGDDTLQKSSGGGTYKDEYLSSDAGLRWSGQVKFEGRVNDNVLREAYKTCDIFVAPSRYESFGLVFLEAMREGKPVIGCLAGGMPEIISRDVNGLLVQPGNGEELAEAILRLAASEKLRTTMGGAGRKIFLEKFTSECMAQASLGLYDLAQRNFQEATA